MPMIFEPKDLPVVEQEATNIATLANSTMLGTHALQVERIMLKPNTKSSMFRAADAERFVYVIKGKGHAHVREETFPLEAESVLWLEKQDLFSLEAGTEGLEILLCHAPARE